MEYHAAFSHGAVALARRVPRRQPRGPPPRGAVQDRRLERSDLRSRSHPDVQRWLHGGGATRQPPRRTGLRGAAQPRLRARRRASHRRRPRPLRDPRRAQGPRGARPRRQTDEDHPGPGDRQGEGRHLGGVRRRDGAGSAPGHRPAHAAPAPALGRRGPGPARPRRDPRRQERRARRRAAEVRARLVRPGHQAVPQTAGARPRHVLLHQPAGARDPAGVPARRRQGSGVEELLDAGGGHLRHGADLDLLRDSEVLARLRAEPHVEPHRRRARRQALRPPDPPADLILRAAADRHHRDARPRARHRAPLHDGPEPDVGRRPAVRVHLHRRADALLAEPHAGDHRADARLFRDQHPDETGLPQAAEGQVPALVEGPAAARRDHRRHADHQGLGRRARLPEAVGGAAVGLRQGRFSTPPCWAPSPRPSSPSSPTCRPR